MTDSQLNLRIGKMDIVLQGPVYDYTIDIANSFLTLNFVNNIILSTWEGQRIPTDISPRVKVVLNSMIENPGITNRNLQIVSSLNGLLHVTTQFSAKLRSDQNISLQSMRIMYDYYALHMDKILNFENDSFRPSNRICVAGIFTKYPIHPRDHIFWGNTNDLLDVFRVPLDSVQNNGTGHVDYSHNVRTETYISMHYCANFNSDVNKFIRNPEIYVVDGARNRSVALTLSDSLLSKIFQPFPKIDFSWPKHRMASYHYHHTIAEEGEVFGD